MRLSTIAAAILLRLLAQASAEVTDEWTYPKAPDRATTLELGRDITIGWTPKLQTWWPAYCPGCNPTSANLYITSVGISGQLPFKHKIASNIDATSELSYKWTVDVPLSENNCEGCGTWKFIFSQDGINGEVSSSTFSIKQASSSDSSSSSSSATPSLSSTPSVAVPTPTAIIPSTTTPSQQSTPSPPTTDTPTTDTPPTGLSTGAKAGIGVGAAAGALILIAVGWFLSRWHSRQKASDDLDDWPPHNETKIISLSLPRHRPLFMSSDAGSLVGSASVPPSPAAWDPNESFYQPSMSVKSEKKGVDAGVRMVTPERSSHELR